MKPEVKKLILLNLPYLLFVYLFGKVGQAFRLAYGIDLSAKLLHIGQGFIRPFFSKKYDITKHPNYKYLSDADKKNAFDVERYIRTQRKKKRTPAVVEPEEPFDLYDIDLSDMNMAAEESGE